MIWLIFIVGLLTALVCGGCAVTDSPIPISERLLYAACAFGGVAIMLGALYLRREGW